MSLSTLSALSSTSGSVALFNVLTLLLTAADFLPVAEASPLDLNLERRKSITKIKKKKKVSGGVIAAIVIVVIVVILLVILSVILMRRWKKKKALSSNAQFSEPHQ